MSQVCFTCDVSIIRKYINELIFLAYKPFFLFECYECRKKTIYCQFCGKVLNKLFNDLYFKCANCNKITRTVSKELVESTSPIHNAKSKMFDFHQFFGNSVISNESCIKNLFGNSSLAEGALINKTNNPFAQPLNLSNNLTVINSNKPSMNLFLSSDNIKTKKQIRRNINTSQFMGFNRSETKKEKWPSSYKKHKNKSPINSYDNKKCKSFGKGDLAYSMQTSFPSAFTFDN